MTEKNFPDVNCPKCGKRNMIIPPHDCIPMTTPFIERKLEEFDENFSGLEPLFMRGRSGDNTREKIGTTEMRVISREMREWFDTSLTKALLEGLKLAEGCVPIIGVSVYANNDAQAFGWNQCREKTLAKIQLLKESVGV